MSDGRRPEARQMLVVPGIDAIPHGLGRAFVVVGVFDGLHRGHLYLLRHLRREATRRGALGTVVTFDHHPDEILTGAAPPLLCDPDERVRLLAAAGVGMTVVQHFDLTLRMTPYEAFVRRIADRVGLAGFLMTPDSAFGHERGGTPAALAELGRSMGFEVVVIPAMSHEGRPVRSAEIRTAIAAGDLTAAAALLGRPVRLAGAAHRGADDRSTEVRTALPVALPPAGAYRVVVEPVGTTSRLRRRLVVAEAGVRLEPSIDVADGWPLHVRLPDR